MAQGPLTRNYQAPNFNVQDTRTVSRQGPRVGQVGRVGGVVTAGDSSWQSRLFGSIAGQWSDIAARAAENEARKAYLRGQSDQALGKSLDTLESDGLTKAWETAGYKDNATKVALTDAQARFMQDLPELAKGTPEEVAGYLEKRRSELVPLLQGMTKEAAGQAFQSILRLDAEAISAYTPARQRYIVSERFAAASTNTTTAVKGLLAANAAAQSGDLDLEAYQKSVAGTAQVVLQNSLADPVLPTEAKQNMLSSAIEYSMAQGDSTLYETLYNMRDSSGASPLQQLPYKSQTKLAEKYVKMQQSRVTAAQLAAREDIELTRARIKDGTYEGSPDDIRAKGVGWIANGYSDVKEVAKLEAAAATMKGKNDKDDRAIAGLLQGDRLGLEAEGYTPGGAIKSLEKRMAASGATEADIQRGLLNLSTVFPEAIEAYSKRVQVQFNQVRQAVSSEGAVPTEARDSVASLVLKSAELSSQGRGTEQNHLLMGLSQEDRDAVLMARMNLENRMSPQEAITKAIADQNSLASRTPSETAGVGLGTAGLTREVIVEQLAPSDAFDRLKDSFMGIWNSTAALHRKLNPKGGMFSQGTAFISNDQAILSEQHKMAEEVYSESEFIRRTKPELAMRQDTLMEASLANVQARSVLTAYGNLTLPRQSTGGDPATFFGVVHEARNVLGEAISLTVGPIRDDSRIRMWVQDGRVMAQETQARTGLPVGSAFEVRKEDVQANVKRILDLKDKEAAAPYTGSTKRSPGGASVTFNGENSIGVDPTVQKQLRAELIKFEDIKDTVYQDKVGGLNVGVGINSGNSYWKVHFQGLKKGDRITQAQLNESFAAATDEAGRFAKKDQQKYGMYGDNSYKLLTHLNFQVGLGGLQKPEYQSMLKAIANGDAGAALVAFSNTGVVKVKHQERTQFYRQLITKAAEDARNTKGTDAYTRQLYGVR